MSYDPRGQRRLPRRCDVPAPGMRPEPTIVRAILGAAVGAASPILRARPQFTCCKIRGRDRLMARARQRLLPNSIDLTFYSRSATTLSQSGIGRSSGPPHLFRYRAETNDRRDHTCHRSARLPCPLSRGDVARPEIQIRLDRTPMERTLDGPPIMAREASLSRYLMMWAESDDRYCGLPFFILRGFRHRFFFIRHDSGLQSLADLRGRRVGITAWFDTGNTWTKAMLHDAGVPVADIDWVLGSLDNGSQLQPEHPKDPPLPLNVSRTERTATLMRELQAGRLDALVAPLPPAGLRQQLGVRRLIVDYRTAEEDYFRRTSIYPACHIVILDRRLARDHPGLLLGLFDVLVDSWETLIANAFLYADAAPWILPALEEATETLGPDWRQHGLDTPANRQMLKMLADEQVRQGHVARRADPLTAFADYAAALASRR